jgi:hypothetical protein
MSAPLSQSSFIKVSINGFTSDKQGNFQMFFFRLAKLDQSASFRRDGFMVVLMFRSLSPMRFVQLWLMSSLPHRDACRLKTGAHLELAVVAFASDDGRRDG